MVHGSMLGAQSNKDIGKTPPILFYRGDYRQKAMAIQYKNILESVKKTITPSDEFEEVVKNTVTEIDLALKKGKLDAHAGVGGSFAKKTHLRGDHDVDIFIRFAQKYKDANISDLFEKTLKGYKLERLHGSRDYFHLHRDGLQYEMVPVLAIKKPADAHNITDFSPWHVEWVKKNGKGINDDIRLAKKFCKANKCYGAESYIRGFSGHVLDILTIHYGGFIKLLAGAQKWKDKQVIDHNDIHKGKALAQLNEAKTLSPLVLIDPVQPARNAASALSEENFRRFIKAAGEFLKKPDMDFFIERAFNPDSIREEKNHVLVTVTPLEAKEDKAGAKIVQAYEQILRALTPFGVNKSGWEWPGSGDGYLWFVLDMMELSAFREQMGPPVKLEAHAIEFKRKYPQAVERKGRMYANVRNEIRTPHAVIDTLRNYINERVKSYLVE